MFSSKPPAPPQTPEVPGTPGAADPLPSALVKLAAVIGLGAIMMQLDMTMTNVATNTLLREFAVPLSTIQWVGSAYLISMATVIPIAGWAMERFGARAIWMASLLAFLTGSILCGLAWSAPSLIAFRVVQGLGGGLIMPLAQAILAQAAGPQRLARAMAVIGVPALLGPVLGPVLGGIIVTDLSWRWIFFVNPPICLVALLLSARLVPARRGAATAPLDLLGLGLLSAGSVGLVYGFAAAARSGNFTGAVPIGAICAGAALLAGYVAHALRGRQEPPIDLRLLRDRAFASASAVMFLSTVVMFGAMGMLPLYYQQVRAETPLRTGLLMIPFGIGMGLSLAAASRSADKVPPRPIALIGLLLAGAGSLALTQLGAGTSYYLLGLVQVISGAGTGAVLVPVMVASLRDLRAEAIPRASTAIRIFQQLGASFGSALLFVVLQHQITIHSAAVASQHPTRYAIADAAAHAFGATFWWAVALAAITLPAALLLPGTALRPAPSPSLGGEIAESD